MKKRVGLSAGFFRGDGEPAYPAFDLTPLSDDPAIEVAVLPAGPDIGAGAFAGFDAVILLSERVRAETFADDNRLMAVVRWGVGYDAIDIAACTAHDVAVVIAPDGVRRPMAVAVITLMLALTTNLMAKDRIARLGPQGFARRADFVGLGLVGRTLGSIGLGNIGAEVFRLARPFGLRHIAHDPAMDDVLAAELAVEPVALDEVFRQADIVTINCPLSEQTRHLVNAERLASMKPTAYLINTARGPIVDQRALYEALKAKSIAGAGLDVFDPEPPNADDPLLTLDNIVLGPHGLGFTDQLCSGLGQADIEAIQTLFRGAVPRNIVNGDVVARAGWRAKLARHGERAEEAGT